MKDIEQKIVTELSVKLLMDYLIHINNQTKLSTICQYLIRDNFDVDIEKIDKIIQKIILQKENLYDYEIIALYDDYIYKFTNNNDNVFNFGYVKTKTTSMAQPITEVQPRRILYTIESVYLVDPNSWVVYHKDLDDEFHIYDENFTRDKIRSKYASTLGYHMNDIRSRKVSNFKF